MKSTAIAIALMLPITAGAFENEPSGFRGIEWETPIESVAAEFSPMSESKSGAKFYTRKGDKLAIGEAALQSIAYVFYKGRFQGAMIRTQEGVGNKRALRDALFAQFGPGHQPNRYMERFYWFGAVAHISLDCLSVRPYCMAFIRSKAMSDAEMADKKTAAEGAKKDF